MSVEDNEVYPLDKNRTLLSEKTDTDGTVYKTFRLFAKNGDSVDVEYVIRHAKPEIKSVLCPNWKIVAQEQGPDGYIEKLMMCEENGEVREYWVEEKIPENTKKRAGQNEESPSKKLKVGDVSSKNTMDMLQQVVEKSIQRKIYAPSDEFLLMLAKAKVEELDSTASKPIITVEHKEALSSAFKKLIDNNILSLPVLLPNGQYHGFLDVLDVVNWVVKAIGEDVLDKEDLDFQTIRSFQEATVAQVMKYPVSKKNPFHPFKVGSTLLSAVEELARGTHRIPVLNDDGKLVNILTQSSVLRFLEKNRNLLGEKRTMKLEDINLSNQYVLSVHEQEAAIDAFRLIKTAHISAVAVVNDDGELVGNCSARDLKKIQSDSRFLSRLFKPLSEYLHQTEIVCAKKHETLETVIARIVRHHRHRIYIVDENLQPDGLLSLGDILTELLKTY